MNLPIKFNITINEIKELSNNIITDTNNWLKFNIDNNNTITPTEFLNSYIYLLNKYDYIINTLYFLRYVSTNKNMRESITNDLYLIQSEYSLNFFKSKENYNLFLKLKKIKIKKNDKNNTKKLIRNILKSFEDNGVHLTDNKQLKLYKIDKNLIKLEKSFSQNIIDDIKIIKFKIGDLNGIDNKTLKEHKVKNKYQFTTQYPDYRTVLKDCSNTKTRKIMYSAFENVARKNINILDKILKLRNKRSRLFGFNTTVDYYLSYNRLATIKKINNLLNRIVPVLKKLAKKEYKNLVEFSGKDKLNDYDISYYSNQYKINKLNIDEKIIQEYFPSNYTVAQIFTIFGRIFHIKISFIKESSNKYWHKEVDLYKVTDKLNNKIIGYIYLDLYPRDGKFTHAATFDLQTSYLNRDNKRVIPVTAIVCNFTKPGNNKKYALFTFNEVETFCHELGHALHNILCKVKYEALSGISMENDFSEMPSQFFENWCYQPEFLKLISKHHISNEKLPTILINKIINNRKFQNGFHYLRQILFIKYDLDIHSKKYSLINTEYLHKHWFKIGKQLLPYQLSTKTYPMCRFDHLIGYQSGYYGYIWSLVYSFDAFEEFKKKGIFNERVGLLFRKEILEKGGTVNGLKMLENFIKRKTEIDPFLEELH